MHSRSARAYASSAVCCGTYGFRSPMALKAHKSDHGCMVVLCFQFSRRAADRRVDGTEFRTASLCSRCCVWKCTDQTEPLSFLVGIVPVIRAAQTVRVASRGRWLPPAVAALKMAVVKASSQSANICATAPAARAIGSRARIRVAPAVKREAEEDWGGERWR